MIIPAELIFKELFTSEFYCLSLGSPQVSCQAWWELEGLGQGGTEALPLGLAQWGWHWASWG